jgi:hypothetical protein
LARILGSAAFTALTIDSVDAFPFLVIAISTPRDPFGADDVVLNLESVMNLRHVFDVDVAPFTVLMADCSDRSAAPGCCSP